MNNEKDTRARGLATVERLQERLTQPSDVPEYTITVTRSAGIDGAVVIFIDGDFMPTGLRVVVNDSDVYADPHFAWGDDSDGGREAKNVSLGFTLPEIDYYTEE